MPLSRRATLVLIGSAACAAPAFAQGSMRAPSIDQGPRDATLVKVRAESLAAAKARNFHQLQPHVVAGIKLDFGGGSGRAELGRRLARRPGLWEELVWVLENGGNFIPGGSFAAPYTFNVDIGKLDVFEAGIVIDDKVSARAEPKADAPVLATLGHEIVKVVDWRRNEKTPSPFFKRRDWVKLELAGGRTAWVEARHVRAHVDFRAIFAKIRGAWKMTAFIAGD